MTQKNVHLPRRRFFFFCMVLSVAWAEERSYSCQKNCFLQSPKAIKRQSYRKQIKRGGELLLMLPRQQQTGWVFKYDERRRRNISLIIIRLQTKKLLEIYNDSTVEPHLTNFLLSTKKVRLLPVSLFLFTILLNE